MVGMGESKDLRGAVLFYLSQMNFLGLVSFITSAHHYNESHQVPRNTNVAYPYFEKQIVQKGVRFY